MANNRQRIYLATANAHKVQEFQRLAEASALNIEFVPATNMPSVVEDTGTFVGNARKKAAALKAILPPDAWVLADDSGLCVDALGGAPGVESAYFAGPEGDAAANLRKLTDVMANVPAGKRGAYFVCVLIFLSGEKGEHVFEGRCTGVLQREPAGGNGFGYDPLFVPEGYQETYAELGDEAKNKISHRGRAWLILAEWLEATRPDRDS
jgi:XTP/dITP diphosphohydrolase